MSLPAHYQVFKVTGQVSDQAQGNCTSTRPNLIVPSPSEITVLSATIVVLQQDHIIDQRVIPALPVSLDYISMRYDVATIMLSSLLHLITQVTPTDPTFSQTLLGILSGKNSYIIPATVRVPAFAEINQLKSPEYGYRQLANLSSQSAFQLQTVPHNLDQQHEVFATDPDHLKSQEYARIWQMYGLKMNRHFILIFNLPQNHPSASLSGSPASRNSSFGGLSPSSESSALLLPFSQQGDTQPSLQHGYMSAPAESYLPASSSYKPFSGNPLELTNGLASSHAVSGMAAHRTPSPLTQIGFSTAAQNSPVGSTQLENAGQDFLSFNFGDKSSDASAGYSTIQPLSPGNAQLSTLPTDSTTAATSILSGIDKHLAACGVLQTEIENAQFQAATSSLVKMVQNIQAVSVILEKLHLPGYQKVTAASTHHVFPDGTRITLGQVLQHFKWTVATYQKKAGAYKWAAEVASWNYTQEVPVEGDPAFRNYCKWKGIVWLFKAQGGCATGSVPDARSPNINESYAAGITQGDLYNNTLRSDIEKLFK